MAYLGALHIWQGGWLVSGRPWEHNNGVIREIPKCITVHYKKNAYFLWFILHCKKTVEQVHHPECMGRQTNLSGWQKKLFNIPNDLIHQNHRQLQVIPNWQGFKSSQEKYLYKRRYKMPVYCYSQLFFFSPAIKAKK